MTRFDYEEIIELCKQHEITLSTCESVTAGMIASYLAKVPGASKVFKGGFVVYSNQAKMKLANVKKETLEKYGAISPETATELAYNTNGILKSTIAISITGNAGPVPDENKPVGQAYCAICVVDKVYLYIINSKMVERNDIRLDMMNQAFRFLLETIRKVIK